MKRVGRTQPGMAPRESRAAGTETIGAREFLRSAKGSYRAHQDLQDAVLRLLAIHKVPARHRLPCLMIQIAQTLKHGSSLRGLVPLQPRSHT